MIMKRILAAIPFLLGGAAIGAYAADAKSNWDDNCAKCHGDTGKGDTITGKKLQIRDFSDAKVQAQFTDDEAFKALKEGLKDQNGKMRMKPVEDMSDEDITALVKYVRGLKPQ